MSTGEPLEQVLTQLDRWRHLPKYRLEPHVDVLFGLTLPTAIAKWFDVKRKLYVIPEFQFITGLLKSASRTINRPTWTLRYSHTGANGYS